MLDLEMEISRLGGLDPLIEVVDLVRETRVWEKVEVFKVNGNILSELHNDL